MYIQDRNDRELAELYCDDGVSGLSYHKREEFKRVIADSLDGKIELLITKSLFRFARNTVDSLFEEYS